MGDHLYATSIIVERIYITYYINDSDVKKIDINSICHKNFNFNQTNRNRLLIGTYTFIILPLLLVCIHDDFTMQFTYLIHVGCYIYTLCIRYYVRIVNLYLRYFIIVISHYLQNWLQWSPGFTHFWLLAVN